ncbi:MAG: sigma-54 dependent transcriptional regulator [Pyrinomonadaceae bacterium]
MTVALFVAAEVPLSAIAAALGREGVGVSALVLTPRLARREVPTSASKAVLVTSERALINIGEQTEQVRELLGTSVPVILCATQPAPHDREVLRSCGASSVITPQSWNVEHVGERVLGQLIADGDITPNRCGVLRGATARLRAIYADIERLAPLSEPLLILGETGTGKDLVARELHARSGRKGSPYVPINCPEIQPDLIGSELFGHEKGAFTGADRARVGLIASAGDGTVFLDEIGDLDLQSQAKLLRVLEERKVRRVGANSFQEVHARVVLATNRDLRQWSADGKFRHDLYERIRGFTLELPPLRERKADIPILVRHFIEEYNEEYRTRYEMAAGSVDALFGYDWPGNVRELRAVIRKAAAYADAAGHVSPLILQESVRRPRAEPEQNVVPFNPALDSWRDLQSRAQSVYFRALLAHTNGNRESAIKISGLSKSQFFEKIKDLPK